ncbi:MAG: RNA polymerase sigma factor [Patescibacteria group bacterium]
MEKSQKSDEVLVEEIRNGNMDLYSEIIARYKTPLSSYINRLSYNSNDSEDILQEVYLKIYRNLFGFDTKKKFSSWAYRIAHNETINYLKKHGRTKINLNLDEIDENIFAEKNFLEDKLDQKFLQKEMADYLNLIKTKYREVLLLYYFEEKSYDEISDILRIPKNTVGIYIHRAKKNLIKELNSKNKK